MTMKTIRAIKELYLMDWRRIFAVPTAVFLVIAMLILPSLYAWFNIKALWDPYGNTGDLPIAVYNADAGVNLEGKKIDIGQMVSEQLHQNHQLGWTFVKSKDVLEDGVRSGKYYAGIYLPKNFSKDLVSFIGGTIEKPEIEYFYNAKINAIAPKITDKGASTLQSEITDNFIATSSQILAETMNKAGVSLETNYGEIEHLSQLLMKTNDNLAQMDEYVNQLKDLQQKLPEIKEKYALAQKVPDYYPEINRLADKLIAVNQHTNQLDQVGKTLLKVQKQLPMIQQVPNRLDQLNQDFSKVQPILTKSIEEAKGAISIVSQVQGLVPTIQDFNDKSNQLLTDSVTGVEKFQEALPSIENSLNLQLQTLLLFSQTMSVFLDQLSQDLQVIDQIQLTPEQRQQLQQIVTQINDRVNQTKQNIEKQIQYLEVLGKITGKDFSKSITQLNQLLEKITQMQEKASQINGMLANLPNQLTTAQKLVSQLQEINNDFNRFLQGIDLTGLSSQINDTLSNQLLPILKDSQKVLGEVSKIDLKDLLEKTNRVLNQGIQILETVSTDLPSYQQKLQAANQLAKSHMGEFTNGVNQAVQFYQNDWPQTKQKLAQASQFAQQDLPVIERDYRQALKQIDAKMPELDQTIQQVNTFINQDWPVVRTAIQKSAQALQVGETKLPLDELIELLKVNAQKEADFFKEPVKLKTMAFYPIKNNGSASAPFYTALCLWVGSLLLSSLASTSVYLNERQKGKYTLREQFFARMLSFLTIGLGQSLVVVLGNLYLLKVSVTNPGWYIAFTVFIGLTFMSIIYVLVSLFGNVGKGLGIILLVLSISGGGGNYPIQVSGAFFRWINPWLPFTYAVNLLREATGGIYARNMWVDIIFLICAGLLFVIFGTIFFPTNDAMVKKFNHRTKNSHFFH